MQPRSACDELEHGYGNGEELEETRVSVETDGEPWIGAELDQDLFQCVGVERLSDRLVCKRDWSAGSMRPHLGYESLLSMNRLTASELKDLQQNDETLEAVRRAANGEQSTAGVGFF